MNKSTFNIEEYYSLLSSKLLDSGLIIGYKDYIQLNLYLMLKVLPLHSITLLMLIPSMLFIVLPT